MNKRDMLRLVLSKAGESDENLPNLRAICARHGGGDGDLMKQVGRIAKLSKARREAFVRDLDKYDPTWRAA